MEPRLFLWIILSTLALKQSLRANVYFILEPQSGDKKCEHL